MHRCCHESQPFPSRRWARPAYRYVLGWVHKAFCNFTDRREGSGPYAHPHRNWCDHHKTRCIKSDMSGFSNADIRSSVSPICNGEAGRQKSVRSADASMQRRALALRNGRLPTTDLTILRFSLLRILPFDSPAHLQDRCGLHLVEVFPYGGSASPTPSGITSGTILVIQPLGYFVA
jgi:hypothetical protein